MSRRDTIIVAVLVNAGLLVVLFASALKSHSSQEEFVSNTPAVIQEAPDLAAKKETPAVSGDEVDIALSQFAKAQAEVPASVFPSQPVAESPVLPTPNFVDDLKPLGSAETFSASVAPSAPVVVAQPQAAPAPQWTEVKVKKGDVLEKIARHHHSTVAEIMKANKLTNTNLRIGQVLKIPNKAAKKSEPSSAVFSPVSEEGAKYYIVKKGDNPWTIAVKNHLKTEDLLKLNNMTEDQARRLKPGDKLRIQ